MDNEETNFLFDLVKTGKVSVSFFTQYIYNFRFDKMEDEQMSVFLKKIVETRTEDSLITAITIATIAPVLKTCSSEFLFHLIMNRVYFSILWSTRQINTLI